MRTFLRLLVVLGIVGVVVLIASRMARPGAPVEGAVPPPSDGSREVTGLRRVSERTFVHDATNVSFTVPLEWTEAGPQHRLERKIDPRVSSVLQIEWAERHATASLSWVPLNHEEKVIDWVREEPVAGEYGEEFETLKAVYGSGQVTRPLRFTQGPFTVYRINYFVPAERTEQSDGAVLLLPVESGGTTWLLKARVSYPRADRGRRDEYVFAILRGYSREPR